MFLKEYFLCNKNEVKKKSKIQKYCLKIQNFRRDEEKIYLNRFLKKFGILEENLI